jgi:predicted nucleotidyltransferase
MIDVSPDHLRLVRSILSVHVAGIEVRAFGSRVDGSAKPHSDLDLAVMTDSPLPSRTAALLREAFAESNLPFRVDIIDWAEISESFRKIILGKSELLVAGD